MSDDGYPRFLSDARNRIYDAWHSIEHGNAGHPKIGIDALSDKDWAKLCGSMDTLLDMEGALFQFWERVSLGLVPYELECLGLLSALYLQQDSVAHIAEIADVEIPSRVSGRLGEIRSL